MNAPFTAGSLDGRVALVTGVSRPNGIAYTVAQRLADRGATVYATGWSPHDAEMPWGASEQLASDSRITFEQRNLELVHEPSALIDAVISAHGAVDIVVATHARSSDGPLATVTAEELDRCWSANVRSIVLIAQAFADRFDSTRHERREAQDGAACVPWGRMIWFTSGQNIQPMPNEIAYSITKAALHSMTASLAEPLVEAGIRANCINPGPVDTGWAPPVVHEVVASMFPGGQWGTPDNVANLIEFLVSDQGAWICGQVINSEGGFRRG